MSTECVSETPVAFYRLGLMSLPHEDACILDLQRRADVGHALCGNGS